MTAIYTVVQAEPQPKQRVRLSYILIAAESPTVAAATWRLWAANLITSKGLSHAFLNVLGADRVKAASACQVEMLDMASFYHWSATATAPQWECGEQLPAVWEQIYPAAAQRDPGGMAEVSCRF
ncbi:hypothetical protein BKK79_37310 (plasmid) [Cupriavidus sp. USMAA2-4]|uniref:hypothetical protein n=1 Tax=Cupriavidus sp. USMAA2-4 TaxID=876364 RepID=UPI0008A6FD93|nr:hypothetical protein [Cupriavidus sp. USMAA2-4]AOY97595.1 hypothetical protein BKK79_37310 [Cupriavidus sp. USMAA2-4]